MDYGAHGVDRGKEMKFATVPVVVAVLGLSLGSAQAFQETAIGTNQVSGQTAGKVAPGTVGSRGPAGLDLATPETKRKAEKSEGPAVTIPGLGRIGVLPKMNFGLELLYGEGDVGEPVTNPQEAPIDDLTIRGSVKHNF